MSLAAERSARQRNDFVMRLGCCLVSVAVLVSLVLEPPKAKAFAVTSATVSALAGGFLNACGLAPVVSGMSSSGEVNESLARLIQDYLDTMGSPTPEEWLGQNIGLTLSGGKIFLPKPVAAKLGQFAAWVASKYGTKAGVNEVYGVYDSHVTLKDGTMLYFSSMVENGANSTITSIGTVINCPSDLPIIFSTGFYFGLDPNYNNEAFAFYDSSGKYITGNRFFRPIQLCFAVSADAYLWLFYRYDIAEEFKYSGVVNLKVFQIGNVISNAESLALDVAETITIPEGLTDSQSVALDVGATDSMSIQDILQGILDAILAGDLAASAEVVDAAEVPVDPPEEPDPPVVPEIPEGLDRLGAALTSRFPFSIPWDVYKGVKLLAAPAKAPYFEVDFLAPIAHRVGGWKGSTKIVLDFSEYEIIGQVCRWTSTIGFCLMLASGTKRLIWTA